VVRLNRDTRYAQEYHEATKHSEVSLRTSRRFLDWENKPHPFKVYLRLPSVPLPREFPHPQLDALIAVASTTPSPRATTFGVTTLAELLYFAAGLTREMKSPVGTFFMRAAAATGALYPIELYLVCQDIAGLRAGVYHFGPGDFALTQLREGDQRGVLASATAGHPSVGSAPVTIVFTSLAWRNTWKYEARSYRHWFWDGGVIAANLLATAVAAGLEAQLILGFADASVNQLLGLEEHREASVVLVPVGVGLGMPSPAPEPASPLQAEVMPLSKNEEPYPEIWKLHDASTLANAQEAAQWRQATPPPPLMPLDASRAHYPLPPASTHKLGTGAGLGEVILRRGSTRRFARSSVTFTHLTNILRTATQGVPVDFLGASLDSLIDVYFIANAVDGLPGGAYYFERATDSVAQLKAGGFRDVAGYLCLEQPLFSDASVVFFLMTSLDAVLKHYGNRGYRAAQLEAGVIAGKIYLAAYAQAMGASGSTFYDDAVTEFFSPHARDRSTMIVVGVGVPAYKARPGQVLLGRLSRVELQTAVS
jgi:SagB-type dehydrogenase family enzyme